MTHSLFIHQQVLFQLIISGNNKSIVHNKQKKQKLYADINASYKRITNGCLPTQKERIKLAKQIRKVNNSSLQCI
jgi:hypothetical protein